MPMADSSAAKAGRQNSAAKRNSARMAGNFVIKRGPIKQNETALPSGIIADQNKELSGSRLLEAPSANGQKLQAPNFKTAPPGQPGCAEIKSGALMLGCLGRSRWFPGEVIFWARNRRPPLRECRQRPRRDSRPARF